VDSTQAVDSKQKFVRLLIFRRLNETQVNKGDVHVYMYKLFYIWRFKIIKEDVTG